MYIGFYVLYYAPNSELTSFIFYIFSIIAEKYTHIDRDTCTYPHTDTHTHTHKHKHTYTHTNRHIYTYTKIHIVAKFW